MLNMTILDSDLAMCRKSSWWQNFREHVQPNTGQLQTFVISVEPQQLQFTDGWQIPSRFFCPHCNLDIEKLSETKIWPFLSTNSITKSSKERIGAMLTTRLAYKLQSKQKYYSMRTQYCLLCGISWSKNAKVQAKQLKNNLFALILELHNWNKADACINKQ